MENHKDKKTSASMVMMVLFVFLIVLFIASFPIFSSVYSYHKLASSSARIKVICNPSTTYTPAIKKEMIDYKLSGVNIITRLVNHPPKSYDEICAVTRPIFFPFGFWTMDFNGNIIWMGNEEIKYKISKM